MPETTEFFGFVNQPRDPVTAAALDALHQLSQKAPIRGLSDKLIGIDPELRREIGAILEKYQKSEILQLLVQILDKEPAIDTESGLRMLRQQVENAALDFKQRNAAVQILNAYKVHANLKIGDYEYRETLQSGESYAIRAYDPNTDTDIVIKGDRSKLPQAVFNVLKTIDHPGITKFLSYQESGDQILYYREYIEGQDLGFLMQKVKRFTENELVKWALQICDTLDLLHNHVPPVMVLDIKPANLIVSPQNQIVIVDFNIAQIYQPGKKYPMIGTEGYSPPEQYRGFPELRSDIYSFGATLHHLATRSDPRLEPPFSFHERPPRQLNPNLSKTFEAVIMKALQFEIGKRFEGIQQMKAELLRCL